MMTSSGFVYDEHGFQNSTAFANDFQSEAATLRLQLNRCSYTFVVLGIRFGFQNSTAFANDFQSEAATLRLQLNRCSYAFEVLSIRFEFQNSTAFANDFQSEAATLCLQLNRCSYTFVVSELQYASVLLFELNCKVIALPTTLLKTKTDVLITLC